MSQADSPWWSARAPTPQPAPQIDEGEESEVELDSLGQLFNEVADLSSDREHDEESHASDVEVISIPSSPEYFAVKKMRQAVRKVPFSHVDAHLDPQFLLKKSQHAPTSKRKTRNTPGELSAGLEDEPPSRRQRTKVNLVPTPSLP